MRDDHLQQLAGVIRTIEGLQTKLAETDRSLMALSAEFKNQIEKAERAEAKFRGLVESAPDAIVVVDSEGKIVLINARTEAMFGYGRRDLLGRPVEILVPERLRQAHAAHRRAYLAAPRIRSIGLDLNLIGLHKDGSEFPVDIGLSPLEAEDGMHVMSIIRDITERRQAEERLRFQAAILENVKDMVLVTDLHGIITYWNEGASALFGYSADEMVGDTPAVLYPDQRTAEAEWVKYFDEIMQGKEYTGEWKGRCKDGSMVWVDAKDTVMRDANGRGVGLIGIAKDITGRKRTEEALRQAKDELQGLSRRLVTVREEEHKRMALELHDEIGQLLTGLKLSIEKGMTLPADEIGAHLHETRRRMIALIHTVRTLSATYHPALLDDLGLLPALLKHFKQYTEGTDIHVAFEHTGIDRRFPSDIELAAYRIVQEGLTNVARHADVAEAKVRLWASRDMLHIELEDQGPGFDFDTVLKAHRGHGLLGMRERTRLLGGAWAIKTAPGEGALITAKFPFTPVGAGADMSGTGE